jgi:hypothetical protein
MIRYRVLTSNNVNHLSKLVDEYLAEGWNIQGGVSISNYVQSTSVGVSVIATIMAQAMVLDGGKTNEII